jgi:hypothetical protein
MRTFLAIVLTAALAVAPTVAKGRSSGHSSGHSSGRSSSGRSPRISSGRSYGRSTGASIGRSSSRSSTRSNVRSSGGARGRSSVAGRYRPPGRASGARPSSAKFSSCARNREGKIARSSTAKRDFQRQHPCPSTGKTSGGCPGYVVDHVQALKHGGADAPSNMQWQTKAEAKAKDRVE